MCGVVGLFLKDKALEPELGAMVATMLETLSDRGPDSAGFAVYGARVAGQEKLTLRAAPGYDFEALAARLGAAMEVPRGRFGAEIGVSLGIERFDTHAVVLIPQAQTIRAVAWLAAEAPEVDLVGQGARMALFKEVGRPEAVARRFGLAAMSGTHAIGHTRMATESAVTTRGAHPFSTGPDQCLVHNGSLSNHDNVRRDLLREGYRFATENDTEVAAVYLTARMGAGLTLGEALAGTLADLDGFYTFLVGTEDGFGVIRDPIACKPAVMAETERYVAFGSEFRALAALPGVGRARLFEPEPARPYFWTH